MRNIRLYIGGKRADLDESTSVPFTFQTTDAEMPTAVKNSYSKTITLQGTDTNRRIFDGLWRLDSLVTEKQQRPPEYVPESSESDAEFTERNVPGAASGDVVKVTGVKGKSIVWNQLVDNGITSVTIPAGHKYYAIINGVRSVGTSTGAAIAVTGGTDSVFDLTQMFGSTIAATMTAAEFEALYPLNYYDYSPNTLVSNSATGIEMLSAGGSNLGTFPLDITGLEAASPNIWDEEWELGQYSNTTGNPATSSANIRSKNYIPVVGGQTYYGKTPSAWRVCTYDSAYGFISAIAGGFKNNTITFGANVAFIRICTTNGATTTYGNNVTINLSNAAYNGHYYPYGTFHPYADGAKSAGTACDVIRQTDTDRYIGVVDLGTLSWTYSSVYGFRAQLTAMLPQQAGSSLNIVCEKYPKYDATYAEWTSTDKAVYGQPRSISASYANFIVIQDSAYTDATTFKAAMSGVYLYYELATPEHFDLLNPLSDIPVPFSTSGKMRRLPQDTASSVLAPFIGSFEYGRIKTYPLPYSFNPMKRVDFQLYVDEMVVERGYCQLAAINRKGRDYTFSVSLFGGLGEFFYNLQTDSDGEKRSLADLDFGSDLGFKINATEVQSNWDTLLGGTLPSIAFVPMHNGVPKTISGDKMLIKGGGLPTSTSDGYTTKSGYLLASLERKYTEWEVGDLRSYLQRPALRVKDFIDAICDPANNGGWKVNLDSDFFDSTNPYYWNTYLLLPQLNVEEETEDICDDGSITPVNDYPTTSTKTKNLTPVSGCMTLSGNYVDMSAYASNAYLKLSLPVQLALTGQANVGNLYMTNRVSHHTENKTICVMAVAWDEEGNMVGVSNRYVFTSKSHRNETGDVKKPSAPYPATDAQIDGYFAYSGGEYKFRLDDYNSDTFALTIDKIQRPSSALHKVRVDFYIQMTTEGIPTLNKYRRGDNVDNVYVSNTQFDIRILSGSNNTLTLVEPTQYATDSQVSQDSLFGALEATPLEILLSYTKRFGLMWIQENSEKEVSVFARKNYYTGEVKDIHNLIDYSKGLKVTPVAAESNNYVLGDKETESTLAEAYLSRYGRNYGEVRLKVGYDFGKEKVEMMEKCEFTEVVDGALSGSGYWAYRNADGNLPSAIADGMKVTYYKESGGTTDTKDLDYNLFNVTGIEKKNSPALGCASKTDDGEETAEEVAPALVFFQGGKVDGTWHLTDDNTAMALLNNSPCWLWDESLAAARVPRFGRVATFSGETYSLDFGTPRETFYIPEVSLAPEQAIYARWWERYLIDLLSKDTKKAECYVVFPPHLDMRHEMRKFYLFDRSLWVLNKVTDYDATKVQPVKCEFIRVTDKEAYTSY